MSVKDWLVISGATWLLMLPAASLVALVIGQGDPARLGFSALAVGAGTLVFSLAAVGRTGVMYASWQEVHQKRDRPKSERSDEEGWEPEISRQAFVRVLKNGAVVVLAGAVLVALVWVLADPINSWIAQGLPTQLNFR